MIESVSDDELKDGQQNERLSGHDSDSMTEEDTADVLISEPNNCQLDSSLTSTSSVSVDKRPCLRKQHLDTINEGNSSDVSDSQENRSSYIKLAESSCKKSDINLENLTRAKLIKRQNQ